MEHLLLLCSFIFRKAMAVVISKNELKEELKKKFSRNFFRARSVNECLLFSFFFSLHLKREQRLYNNNNNSKKHLTLFTISIFIDSSTRSLGNFCFILRIVEERSRIARWKRRRKASRREHRRGFLVALVRFSVCALKRGTRPRRRRERESALCSHVSRFWLDFIGN